MEIVKDVLKTVIDKTANIEETKTIFIGNTMKLKHERNKKKKTAPKPPSNRIVTKEKKWVHTNRFPR